MNFPYHHPKEISEMSLCTSQLLGCVVKNLFPNVLLAGGGVNSLGFYYDFIFQQPLTESLLDVIEVELRSLIKKNLPLKFLNMMRENAASLFDHHSQPLLADQANAMDENILSILQVGEFYGLCPPLSLEFSEQTGHVKLLGVEEFFFSTNEKGVFPIRIFGVTQKSFKELKAIVKAYHSFMKKKDHRFLAREIDLFSFNEKSSEVTWHPKGYLLGSLLKRWAAGYCLDQQNEITTNQGVLLRSSLTPAHLEFFGNGGLKLDNFPRQVQESAILSRPISPSKKWGLLSASSWQTMQTTILCLNDQVIPELISSLHFIERISTILGFEGYWILVASRKKTPKRRQEEEAINWLKEAIKANPLKFSFSVEEEEQEGIEGPRLELRVYDCIKREWTVSTTGIVRHFSNASFECLKKASKGEPLVVITRCLWESLDRLIALLVEYYEGVFPLWLAPEQVRLIAIGESNHSYVRYVQECMRQKGLRTRLDLRREPLDARVHEAKKEKVPYIVLIGDSERTKQRISVYPAEGKTQNQWIELEPFLDKLYKESLPPRFCNQAALIGESESA